MFYISYFRWVFCNRDYHLNKTDFLMIVLQASNIGTDWISSWPTGPSRFNFKYYQERQSDDLRPCCHCEYLVSIALYNESRLLSDLRHIVHKINNNDNKFLVSCSANSLELSWKFAGHRQSPQVACYAATIHAARCHPPPQPVLIAPFVCGVNRYTVTTCCR